MALSRARTSAKALGRLNLNQATLKDVQLMHMQELSHQNSCNTKRRTPNSVSQC